MPHHASNVTDRPRHGDAIVGQWSHERLVAMDQRFRQRMRDAVASVPEPDSAPEPASPREALIAHLRALEAQKPR